MTDLNFTNKTYQSGKNSGEISAFYYTKSLGTITDIYKSSNLDPGPVMNYTFTAFDVAQDVVTLTFSGNAYDVNRNIVNITNGKVTVKLDRY